MRTERSRSSGSFPTWSLATGDELVDVLRCMPSSRPWCSSKWPQGQTQLADLGPHAGQGQVSHQLHVLLPGHQRLEHAPGSLAEHVRDHRVELDSSVLKQLLNALGLLAALLDQLPAVAGQVAHPSHRLGGHGAASEQPAFQQLGQPGRVPHVDLAIRQVLDLVRVDEEQLNAVELFKHEPDRPPVDPRRFHRHLGDTFSGEPLPKASQRGGEGAELPHLLLTALQTRPAHTRRDHVLAYIQGSAPLDDYVYETPPSD